MPVGMLRLEEKGCIFLIAFGRETHVIKLDLVHAGLGGLLGQGDVVFLHFGLRRIGPNQLAVFTPGLASLVRFHRQLRMRHHQPLVTENCHSRDGMHSLRMQEMQ